MTTGECFIVIRDLPQMILEHRIALNMTQSQYGRMFGISGPAIFKFEKGYVNPSFSLWMEMATKMELGEGDAVLIWVKAKLPGESRDMIDLRRSSGNASDLSVIMDHEKLRAAAMADNTLPPGLRKLVSDDEIWLCHKPTGRELNLLREQFGRFGGGTKALYRRALQLLRDFTGKED
jgi:DNA-binding XRE family transcriptional regulator